MNLYISHIFKEKNTCADKLDDSKFSSHNLTWCNALF